MIRVENVPRDYAWGSVDDIARLRGVSPSGKPEAELWLGTHPGSPTNIVGAKPGEPHTIAELLAKTGQEPLPYLLKLLAAAKPLSIQAHPSKEQAQAGFARENAAGIALEAPHRNYRDDNHKPELIVALSERFEALCGFRPVEETLTELSRIAAANRVAGESATAIDAFHKDFSQSGITWALEWALSSGQTHELIAELSTTSALAEAPVLRALVQEYPGDPGIVVALLLNHVVLNRGQALYLPAGNMHAYLRGFGVELMSASDNVLRGGLTTKHVDVPELLSVVKTDVLPVPLLPGKHVGAGVTVFRPDVPDFTLAHVELGDGKKPQIELSRHAIAVCTSGELRFSGKTSHMTLNKGEMAFISSDEGTISTSGTGEAFIAL